MKTIFTSVLSVLAICVLLLSTADTVRAQTVTTLESGRYYTALTKDAAGNLYGLRLNAAQTFYELVKFTGGSGTPNVLATGLKYDGSDYPWGVAVASNGNIYVAAANLDNKIILYTYNSGNDSYSAADFKSGTFCTNLVLDKDDNLYTLEWVTATSDYAVIKYPAGSTTGNGTGMQLFHGLISAASYPTGLAIAGNGDIYATDGFNSQVNEFGAVYKVTAASGYDFSLRTTISAGKYSSSLALDPAGNLYVSEYDGSSTMVLNEYPGGAGSPVKLHDLLIGTGYFYPWGIVAYNEGDVYFATGDDDVTGGALLHLLALPDLQASNVAFSNVENTRSTVSWTPGSGRAHAVFMASATTGSPAPSTGTTYTANAAFGSGSQISSSGWYCVYNGSGSSVDVTGLTAGKTYRVMAVDYNGAAGEEQYFTVAATNNPMNLTLSGALPVSWLDFNVTSQQNTVTWTWQLAMEENIESYMPQYSLDGLHYVDAGKITKLDADHTYSFTATLVLPGSASFRIKVTDLNGVVKYSEVRTLNTAGSSKLFVYPNPATDFVYIQNVNEKATSAQVRITETSGRTVSKQHVTSVSRLFKISLSPLSSGIYFITLKDNLGHIYTSGPVIKK